jgi:hypothetical protein
LGLGILDLIWLKAYEQTTPTPLSGASSLMMSSLFCCRTLKADTPVAAALMDSIQLAALLRRERGSVGAGGAASAHVGGASSPSRPQHSSSSSSSTTRLPTTAAEAAVDRWLLLAGLTFCNLFRAASNSARAAMVTVLKPNGCLDQMLAVAAVQLDMLTPTQIKQAVAMSDTELATNHADGTPLNDATLVGSFFLCCGYVSSVSFSC